MGAEGSYQDELTRDLDVVRMMIGDTNVEDDELLLSDDHINSLITREGSVNGAALAAARELLATYASLPTSASANGVTYNYVDRLAIWSRIVSSLQVAASPTRSSLSFVKVKHSSTSASSSDEYDRHGY